LDSNNQTNGIAKGALDMGKLAEQIAEIQHKEYFVSQEFLFCIKSGKRNFL
jgi:hypothetical protein